MGLKGFGVLGFMDYGFRILGVRALGFGVKVCVSVSGQGFFVGLGIILKASSSSHRKMERMSNARIARAFFLRYDAHGVPQSGFHYWGKGFAGFVASGFGRWSRCAFVGEQGFVELSGLLSKRQE